MTSPCIAATCSACRDLVGIVGKMMHAKKTVTNILPTAAFRIQPDRHAFIIWHNLILLLFCYGQFRVPFRGITGN
jgi:hypothetical protein